MPRRNSTTEIKEGKVVFSKEILEYFESIRTEENSAWVDKYFEYLSDEENLTAEKYNIHHIRPCFSFKDKTHRTRKETEPLADKVEGNIIKLSIYNHILVHYFLWKIYDNRDSKNTMQRMCGEGKYIDGLTERELKEIARLKEDCAKTNQTEEERKERQKKKYNKANIYIKNHIRNKYLSKEKDIENHIKKKYPKKEKFIEKTTKKK